MAITTEDGLLQEVNGLLDWQNIKKKGLKSELFDSSVETYINALVTSGVATILASNYKSGTSTLTWTASKTAAPKEITHEAGFTPSKVLTTIKFEGTSSAFTNAGKYTSTKFTLYGYNAPEALSATLEVVWWAIK